MKADFRFVVDTNVLVSVILSPSNTSRLAVEKATNNKFLILKLSCSYLGLIFFDRTKCFRKW